MTTLRIIACALNSSDLDIGAGTDRTGFRNRRIINLSVASGHESVCMIRSFVPASGYLTIFATSVKSGAFALPADHFLVSGGRLLERLKAEGRENQTRDSTGRGLLNAFQEDVDYSKQRWSNEARSSLLGVI